MPVTENMILDALRAVRDPERDGDIVSLGMVTGVVIRDGNVGFAIEVEPERGARLEPLRKAAERAVEALPDVMSVTAVLTAEAKPPGGARRAAPVAAPAQAAPAAGKSAIAPGVRAIVAVASGKGGVGKSTVAVNLAVALRATGATVGIVDADVYGPDIPMMLGTRGRPGMFENRIIPVEAHGIKMMSIGLLVQEKEALVWRGPMIHSFIQQMLRDVMWGALDYLVFDMPPGTGDAQLSLSQILPLSGVVMVTTPQDVALLDVRKALGMFQRLNVPILGVVENMSGFVCPHCGERTAIFGDAGGNRISEEYGVPLLARIPLEPDTRIAGDQGTPITLQRPEGAQAHAFGDLARAVERRLEELGPLSSLPTIR